MKKIISNAHPVPLKGACAQGKVPFRGFRGKKIILTLACFCFLFSDSFSQEIEWQKILGGGDYDYANSIKKIDNGFVIAGGTQSNDGDVSGNHGNMDIWVARLDNYGNILWQKCLGGTASEFTYSIIQTNDKGFAIAGWAGSNDGDVSGNHGSTDAWVVKLDSAGNLQWQKCLGGTGGDAAYSIVQTFENGFAVAGMTGSNDGDVSGNHGDSDYWIVKLDSVGNIIWQKCLGGSYGDNAYSVVQTFDHGFAIAGITGSNDGDVSGNHGYGDIWVVKIDSNSNLQWQKCFGGSGMDDGFTSIIQRSDSGFAVVGSTKSIDGDVIGKHGDYDGWFLKLDNSGNLIWQKCLGGSDSEGAMSVLLTTDGGYAVAGTTYSMDGDVSGNKGLSDYWLVKLDTSGNIQWQKSIGGNSVEQCYSVCQINDDEFAVAGYASSFNNGDVTNFKAWYDCWIVKIRNDFNSITGKLFIDSNSSGVQDAGEPAVNHNPVYELNTGGLTFSQSTGAYYLNVLDTGDFIVTSSLNYYNPVPLTHTVNFSSFHQTDSLNDFAFQPLGIFNDLCVTITPLGPFRANQNASYMINYENVGTTALNGTVIFFPDNDITFVSANPIATSVTTDSVVWNVGTLTPFQTGNILVTVNVNAGTPIGTLINSMVKIEPIWGDANTECNTNVFDVYVTGSVDPNAILVDRDTVLTTELSSPPYLNYIIYFQNTGNDTAFNARVLNNIPQTLDVNSFEFVASSHPMNITYGAHSRLFTFTFDNILLPDSNINEPASHGFIRYKIKPISTLVVGDSIKNNAFIYFDFNQPVLTDTAVTEIVLPTGEEEFKVQSLKFKVFPNPVRNELEIKNPRQGDKTKYEITVSDITGRLNFRVRESKLPAKLDVSKFAAGIYFLVINDGNTFFRTKVVKQ